MIKFFPLPRIRKLSHNGIFSLISNLIGVRRDIGIFKIKNRRSRGSFNHHFNMRVFSIGLILSRSRDQLLILDNIFRGKGLPLGLRFMLNYRILSRSHHILVIKVIIFVLIAKRISVFILFLLLFIPTWPRHTIIIATKSFLFIKGESFSLNNLVTGS